MSTEPAAELFDVVAAWAAYRRAAAALAWIDSQPDDDDEHDLDRATLDHATNAAAVAAIHAAEAAALAHVLARFAAAVLARDIESDEAVAAGDPDIVLGGTDAEAAEQRADAGAYATTATVDLARWHMATAAAADVVAAAEQSAAALLDVAGFADDQPKGARLALPSLLAGSAVRRAFVGLMINEGQESAAAALLRQLRSVADMLEQRTGGAPDDPTDGAP